MCLHLNDRCLVNDFDLKGLILEYNLINPLRISILDHSISCRFYLWIILRLSEFIILFQFFCLKGTSIILNKRADDEVMLVTDLIFQMINICFTWRSAISRVSIFDQVKPMWLIKGLMNLHLIRKGLIIRLYRMIFIRRLVWFDGKIVARLSVALCNHVVQPIFSSLETSVG